MNKRMGSTRVAIERMHYIARRLRDLQPVNCTSVARHFEICRKTAQLDIVFMRDRLGWDIAYDHALQSYTLNSAPMAVL